MVTRVRRTEIMKVNSEFKSICKQLADKEQTNMVNVTKNLGKYLKRYL